jgi:diguanylate cyclase (GGDEF)-like protein
MHLNLKQLQNERVDHIKELEHLSTTDQLTGMRNRRYLEETLDIEFRRADRHKTALSILMVDLDNFKHINDAYGHPAGDSVLSEAGRRIRGLTRSTDISVRYGGEEFLGVLTHNNTQQALVAAERWRCGLSGEPFEIPGGEKISVTASIGVATYDATCELAFDSAAALIAAADEALYRAKDQGRDCVVHASLPDRSA